MKKYLVVAGEIRSKSDAQTHFITASQLMRLYGVKASECYCTTEREFCDNTHSHSIPGVQSLILLTPRYDGNYSIPNLKVEVGGRASLAAQLDDNNSAAPGREQRCLTTSEPRGQRTNIMATATANAEKPAKATPKAEAPVKTTECKGKLVSLAGNVLVMTCKDEDDKDVTMTHTLATAPMCVYTLNGKPCVGNEFAADDDVTVTECPDGGHATALAATRKVDEKAKAKADAEAKDAKDAKTKAAA